MKRRFLVALQEKFMSLSSKPWACFETSGPDNEGRIGFSISWNKAFIKNLKSLGYEGMDEEEIVQTFFISTRMLPEGMVDDIDTVNPAATPNLTNEANTLRR